MMTEDEWNQKLFENIDQDDDALEYEYYQQEAQSLPEDHGPNVPSDFNSWADSIAFAYAAKQNAKRDAGKPPAKSRAREYDFVMPDYCLSTTAKRNAKLGKARDKYTRDWQRLKISMKGMTVSDRLFRLKDIPIPFAGVAICKDFVEEFLVGHITDSVNRRLVIRDQLLIWHSDRWAVRLKLFRKKDHVAIKDLIDEVSKCLTEILAEVSA